MATREIKRPSIKVEVKDGNYKPYIIDDGKKRYLGSGEDVFMIEGIFTEGQTTLNLDNCEYFELYNLYNKGYKFALNVSETSAGWSAVITDMDVVTIENKPVFTFLLGTMYKFVITENGSLAEPVGIPVIVPEDPILYNNGDILSVKFDNRTLRLDEQGRLYVSDALPVINNITVEDGENNSKVLTLVGDNLINTDDYVWHLYINESTTTDVGTGGIMTLTISEEDWDTYVNLRVTVSINDVYTSENFDLKGYLDGVPKAPYDLIDLFKSGVSNANVLTFELEIHTPNGVHPHFPSSSNFDSEGKADALDTVFDSIYGWIGHDNYFFYGLKNQLSYDGDRIYRLTFNKNSEHGYEFEIPSPYTDKKYEIISVGSYNPYVANPTGVPQALEYIDLKITTVEEP